MTSLSNQQLQSFISELEKAYHWHDQWYKSFLRVLITHISPEPEDLMPDAHLRCDFGRWYNDALSARLFDTPQFFTLGSKHEKLHRIAATLLKRISDDILISVSDWDLFQNTLDDLRHDLQSLKFELENIIQNRDPLTGARNRSNMQSDLREKHALVQRGVTTCALAMLDLDHFKSVNDNFCHSAGDAVLVSTVQCIQDVIRPYDRVYRYGGEEFLICMPGVTSDQAHQLAERLRAAISTRCIRFDNSDQCIKVTVSIGVAMLSSSRLIEDSIGQADKAMYKAKAAGRNRVVVDV